MTPMEWMLGNDTGMSSKTICAVMTGNAMSRPEIPYDPSDFGRCYRLLNHFPEWKERMPEMAEAHGIWGPMVEAWDELTALYEEEIQSEAGRAPNLYARMQEIVDDCCITDGWEKVGVGSWRKSAA